MASVGINVSADGRHTGASLDNIGARWARIVARRDFDLTPILKDYRWRRISTILTLDRLSIEAYGPVDTFMALRASAGDALADYHQRYSDLIDVVQPGNEPDHESPSSWTLAPDVMAMLGRVTRDVFPDHIIISPGLVSGQISYLDGVDLSWCDAIAIHPYLRDAPNPNDLEDIPDIPLLVNEYASFGKQVWVTEWGWWSDEEARGAEEVGDMIAWAAATDTIGVFMYFCMDDAMVPPFGLYHADGSPKEAARAYATRAANQQPVKLPIPDGGGPIPEPPKVAETPEAADLEMWRQGWTAIVPTLEYSAVIHGWAIPTYWRSHYGELGSPLGNEIPEGGGPTRQMFAGGALRWNGTAVERIA